MVGLWGKLYKYRQQSENKTSDANRKFSNRRRVQSFTIDRTGASRVVLCDHISTSGSAEERRRSGRHGRTMAPSGGSIIPADDRR